MVRGQGAFKRTVSTRLSIELSHDAASRSGFVAQTKIQSRLISSPGIQLSIGNNTVREARKEVRDGGL